ncbi:MAG: hypothetical protein ACK4F9_06390 [Brevinematia bacterium]
MKRIFFGLLWLVFFWLVFVGVSFSEIKFLKYYISILGIRAGEVVINFSQKSNIIISHSVIKTYPVILLSVNMDTVSYIDADSLKTTKMITLNTGRSFKDTNVVVFDRKNKSVIIDSAVFGKIYVDDTNSSANDLSAEIIRATRWNSLPSEFSLTFVETTNTRTLGFTLQNKMTYYMDRVKDGYIEFTNINNMFVFYKANVPIFYLFPFGNISFYLELSEFELFGEFSK